MTGLEAIYLSGAASFQKSIPRMCAPSVLADLKREVVKDEWRRGWDAAKLAKSNAAKEMALELGFCPRKVEAWWAQ